MRCAIFGTKMAHLSWKFFLVQTIIVTFIYLLAFFIVQNWKKNLTADPEIWGCTILEPKMVHLPWSIFFFWKIINTILIYLLALHCGKFYKNSSSGSRVWGCTIFGTQNGPFLQMRIFFQKPVNEPCLSDSCLSTCQKSNLLVIHWRLENTEISLAKSHFWL